MRTRNGNWAHDEKGAVKGSGFYIHTIEALPAENGENIP
jgi:hypothetical protein